MLLFIHIYVVLSTYTTIGNEDEGSPSHACMISNIGIALIHSTTTQRMTNVLSCEVLLCMIIQTIHLVLPTQSLRRMNGFPIIHSSCRHDLHCCRGIDSPCVYTAQLHSTCMTKPCSYDFVLPYMSLYTCTSLALTMVRAVSAQNGRVDYNIV